MNPPLGGHVCSDLGFGGDGGQAAAGEDVEAEIAAAFGPFVGLFGQDRADEADDRLAVRQDPDRVGAAPDLPVQPFGEVIRPDLGPDLGGEAGEGEDVGAGRVEVVMNLPVVDRAPATNADINLRIRIETWQLSQLRHAHWRPVDTRQLLCLE
jgi:hypothetical protein